MSYAPITTILFSTSKVTETSLYSTTLTSIFPSVWTNLSTTTATNLSARTSSDIYNVTTTTLLPIPVVGQLPLTAKILGETLGLVTFAVQDCTTPAASCVWVEPLTVTAGPSTVHIDGSNYWKALGELDCTWDSAAAQITSTLGAYPSSQLKGDAKGWVTTPAPSSITLTLSDKGLRNFAEVTVTRLNTDVVTSTSTNIVTKTITNVTTSTVTDLHTSLYNVTTTALVTGNRTETLTPSSAYPNYWNDARRLSGAGVLWRTLRTAVVVSLAMLLV